MKSLLIHAIIFFMSNAGADSYEIPSPLQNIGINLRLSFDASSGLYVYMYKVSNPLQNGVEIDAIRIAVSRDPNLEAEVSSVGLNHCRHHSQPAQERNLAKTPMVRVGSSTPEGWSCDYEPQGDFTFAGVSNKDGIKPGQSQEGFIIKSYAPPAIRDVKVAPTLDIDRLPDTYNSDPAKLVDLERNITWAGRTIGPKAPPKVFVALATINDLILLKNQSFSLGWIREKGVANSLGVKLDEVKRKMTNGDNKTAKNILVAFQNEVKAQSGKQITEEAYALLYFNAKYLIDHLK